MSLYDLPKDILIKMISEIEQKTITKFEERLKNEKIFALECDYCKGLYSSFYDWKFSEPNYHGTVLYVCKECFNQHHDPSNFSWENLNQMSKNFKHKYTPDIVFDIQDTKNKLFLKDIERK